MFLAPLFEDQSTSCLKSNQNVSTDLNLDLDLIMPKCIDLGINIDHIATLRNARGTAYPCPLKAAQLAEYAGADLITLHLREDRRHIKDADVLALKSVIKSRMNLECALTQEMLTIACHIQQFEHSNL